MTWDDFTCDEKRAILKSSAYVANADGRVNHSEDIFLATLLLRMHGDERLMRDALGMWKINMVRVLRGMNAEKKAIVLDVWVDVMCRSMGGVYSAAHIRLDEFPEEAVQIRAMARDCNIDTSKYE